MAERLIAGALALSGFAPFSDPNWNVWMDANLRKVSVLTAVTAISRVTALPGAPTNGQVYIVPSAAGSNANEIAARDAGAWVYFVPFVGLRAHVADEDKFVYWNGTAWVLENPVVDQTALTVETKTAAYTPVLGDQNKKYIRMNLAAGAAFTVPLNSAVAFPVGSTLTLEQSGAGVVVISPTGGVTLNSRGSLLNTAGQFAVAVLTKTATDAWTLTGDLA